METGSGLRVPKLLQLSDWFGWIRAGEGALRQAGRTCGRLKAFECIHSDDWCVPQGVGVHGSLAPETVQTAPALTHNV